MVEPKKFDANGIPRIALVVTDREDNEAIRALGVDMLELRIDQFRSQGMEHLRRTVLERKELDLPMILTVRNDPVEGGVKGIDEDEKHAIFRMLAPFVSTFDVELSSPIRSQLIQLAKDSGLPAIISRHDFQGTPGMSDLEAIFTAGREAGGDIVKIAARANSMDDLFRLLELTRRHRDEKVITISMGPFGGLSRLVFPAAGSLVTYSFIDQPSAPGQIPVTQLIEDFHRYYPQYDTSAAEEE